MWKNILPAKTHFKAHFHWLDWRTLHSGQHSNGELSCNYFIDFSHLLHIFYLIWVPFSYAFVLQVALLALHQCKKSTGLGIWLVWVVGQRCFHLHGVFCAPAEKVLSTNRLQLSMRFIANLCRKTKQTNFQSFSLFKTFMWGLFTDISKSILNVDLKFMTYFLID